MILNIMQDYDVAALGHNSAEAIHLYAEAKKLVWADRNTYVADADANQLLTAGLISKPYAEARRKLIDHERAATDVTPGQPFEHSDAVYLTVVVPGPQNVAADAPPERGGGRAALPNVAADAPPNVWGPYNRDMLWWICARVQSSRFVSGYSDVRSHQSCRRRCLRRCRWTRSDVSP